MVPTAAAAIATPCCACSTASASASTAETCLRRRSASSPLSAALRSAPTRCTDKARCCLPAAHCAALSSSPLSAALRSAPTRCTRRQCVLPLAGGALRRLTGVDASTLGHVSRPRSPTSPMPSPLIHYLPDEGLATAIFLALRLHRPLLLEGEAGVGKTEVAKVLARWTGGGADPPPVLRGHRRRRRPCTSGTTPASCSTCAPPRPPATANGAGADRSRTSCTPSASSCSARCCSAIDRR